MSQYPKEHSTQLAKKQDKQMWLNMCLGGIFCVFKQTSAPKIGQQCHYFSLNASSNPI